MNPLFAQEMWVLVMLSTRLNGIFKVQNSEQQLTGAVLYCDEPVRVKNTVNMNTSLRIIKMQQGKHRGRSRRALQQQDMSTSSPRVK